MPHLGHWKAPRAFIGLFSLLAVLVMLDTAFESAVTPLLPYYKAELSLSVASTGLLSASYPIGVILAALPSGRLVARLGPRLTIFVGASFLGLSSLAFGFAHQGTVLVLVRVVHGASGTLIWTAAAAWLVTSFPDAPRGRVIGALVGAATAGALIGPLLAT